MNHRITFLGYLSDIAGFEPGFLYARIDRHLYRLGRSPEGQPVAIEFDSIGALIDDAKAYQRTASNLVFVTRLEESPFDQSTLAQIVDRFAREGALPSAKGLCA